jgi:hypothetical protein
LSRRLTGPSASLLSERRNAVFAARASWGVHVLPPAAGGQLDGPQGPCLGQAGHGTGQAVVVLGGHLPLAAEHLRREQERAAVDRRLLQVLAERDHGPVHHPDPGPLRPGSPIGCEINQHGRLARRQQPLQPSLAEDVIGGRQHEQRLTLDLALDRGQRRAVAICSPVGIHDLDLVAPEPADDGRDRSGVVADHDQDPLQPSGQE